MMGFMGVDERNGAYLCWYDEMVANGADGMGSPAWKNQKLIVRTWK